MTDEIHIVINRLDLSDDYNKHAAATIASILEHCSKPIHFHITHDGDKSFKQPAKTEENISKYCELVQKYGSCIEFHDLQHVNWNGKLPQNIIDQWPSICTSRLYFHMLFPNIDYLLLIGADAIVNLDINNIFKRYPISEYAISGCKDMGFCALFETWNKNVKEYYNKIEIVNDQYCNADMMIFNLKKIREISPDKEIYEFLEKYPAPFLNEQDVLNSIYRNDKFILPQQYNIQTRSIEVINQIRDSPDKCESGYVQHSKFWIGYIGEADIAYWKSLSLTPWGNGKLLFKNMGDTFYDPKYIIQNITMFIKSYPIRKIIKILWSFTIPLYLKILTEFLKYIKKGNIDYESLRSASNDRN